MSSLKTLAKIEWRFHKLVHDCLITNAMSNEQSYTEMKKIFHEESDRHPILKPDIERLLKEYKSSIK